MSTEPHAIADDQVRSAFQRWKNLEEEKARIGDDLKELFAEQKAFGHDTKAMRAAFRLKVKMDEADPADAEHEALVDTYLAALEAPRASRAYARENIEQFDANPRLIKQVVDGIQSEAGKAALLTAINIMIEREEAEELEASDGSPSVSSKLAARVAEESAATHSPETADEMQHPGSHLIGNPEPARAAANRPNGEDGTVRMARTEATAVTAGETATHSEKATVATQGEATAPTSDDRADHAAAANAGGDHVNGGALRANRDENGEGAASTLPIGPGVFMEDVPPMPMKRPGFAHCFPELSNAAYDALGTDIAFKGMHTPIVRQGDVIVDGWARYNIARDLGISYPVQEYSGSDLLLDLIEWQRASRNFTPAQERKIAAQLAKEFPHRAGDIMAAFGLAEALEAAQ